jgi:hypothetical protein
MIKSILTVVALSCAVMVWSTAAADDPASDASIKQLLDVVQVRKLVEAMSAQMDLMMKQAVEQATHGEQIPPRIQQDIDKRQAEIRAAVKESLDWNKMEPVYMRVYQKSFTQQEVDGLIAFYKTPAGQALVNKMPVVMQNAVNETQQLMQPTIERIRKMQQEVGAEVQAEKGKKGG